MQQSPPCGECRAPVCALAPLDRDERRAWPGAILLKSATGRHGGHSDFRRASHQRWSRRRGELQLRSSGDVLHPARLARGDCLSIRKTFARDDHRGDRHALRFRGGDVQGIGWRQRFCSSSTGSCFVVERRKGRGFVFGRRDGCDRGFSGGSILFAPPSEVSFELSRRIVLPGLFDPASACGFS
jgi:hypothetical protein